MCLHKGKFKSRRGLLAVFGLSILVLYYRALSSKHPRRMLHHAHSTRVPAVFPRNKHATGPIWHSSQSPRKPPAVAVRRRCTGTGGRTKPNSKQELPLPPLVNSAAPAACFLVVKRREWGIAFVVVCCGLCCTGTIAVQYR